MPDIELDRMLSERLKTAFGSFPVSGLHVIDSSVLGFEFPSVEGASSGKPPDASLEELASALPMAGGREDGNRRLSQAQVDSFKDVVRRLGPLFGEARPESLLCWQMAIDVASTAVQLQEYLNGDARKERQALGSVAKTLCSDAETGAYLFTLYLVPLRTCVRVGTFGEDRYARYLPSAPWVKSFSSGRSNDYVVVTEAQDDEGGADATILDLWLISCEQPLSTELFAYLLSYLTEQSNETAERLLEAAKAAGIDVDFDRASRIEGTLTVRPQDAPAGSEDHEQLQHLVHALISMHLQNVRIDLFKAPDSTGFLLFDSLLSYLWYGFAQHLGAVKVGYCQQCGRGFSLTGHRGPAKKFCSDACRIAFKNQRATAAREAVRNDYLSGMSVQDIAKTRFPQVHNSEDARQQVLTNLRRWKQLTNHIRAELASDGESPLARRAVADGIIDAGTVEKLVRAEAVKRQRVK